MATTNQKSIIDIYTKKPRKECKKKKITKESQQITREKSQRKWKEQKGTQKKNPKTVNKTAISAYLSVITSCGINAPIKKYTMAKWVEKQDSCICWLQENHFRCKDTHRLKVQGWKNVFHTNRNEKKKPG